MASSSSSPLVFFTVRRQKPKLVVPAMPTPREMKQLSDIDDQEGFRFHVPVIMFYRNNTNRNSTASMEGKDPVKVIREALAKALVFYYPFAGRLIEGPNRKLIVDCNGEGVLYIEAEAEVCLDQLGDDAIHQPGCPYLEELLHDVPGSQGILGCPLLLIQVTRFSCGGFTFAVRLNHTMSDGQGLFQLLNTIAEFANGTEGAPSVQPVWQRDLLTARQPPHISYLHREYEQVLDNTTTTNEDNNLIHKSFFFGPKELTAIRNHLPRSHLTKCSTFELLTACLWKCRTRALEVDPDQAVRICCIFNGRSLNGFNIPPGYYGNVFAFPAAVSKAKMVCNYPLGYIVELVKKAKAQMSEEYLRSVADLMVTKGRPIYTLAWNYIISDTTRIGFDKVDFGWGKPVYGGVARAISLISFYTRFRDGIMVPICLPQQAMERFQQELEEMISVGKIQMITSSL